MPVIDSLIDRRSSGFQANAEAMRGLIADLRRLAETVSLGGGRRHAIGMSRAGSCCRAIG